MNRVELRPEAETDIRDAAKWYDQQTAGLGAIFLSAVDHGLSVIAQNPLAFSRVRKGARRYPLRRFPYAIIYRVRDDVVVVYSCIHGRRDPRRWQKRLSGS